MVNMVSSVSTGVDRKVVRLVWFLKVHCPAVSKGSRKLREIGSGSAALSGLFLAIIGAPGTAAATSPACGAPGPGLIATSGAFAGGTSAQGESGPGDQTGNAETGQNLFQVVNFHVGLLLNRVDVGPFPGAENRQTGPAQLLLPMHCC